MSISGDSWHKVPSEVPGDGANEEDLMPQPRPQPPKQQQQPWLVISDANVEETSTGIFLRLRGGLTLLFVIVVWVIGVSEGVQSRGVGVRVWGKNAEC